MRGLALALFLVACSGPAKQAPLQGKSDRPARPAPTTAPPRVQWIDNGFDTPGLPAITADGSKIVLAEIENDGGRGNPNLRIVARDRNDAVGESITVLEVSEVESMFDQNGKHPQLDLRISAANAWLARLHTEQELIPLAQLKPEGEDRMEQHAMASGPARIEWTKDVLKITRAGTILVKRDTPAVWNATPQANCTNPSILGGAWIDLDRKAALVEVAYTGSDMCWEPSPQHHVITWP